MQLIRTVFLPVTWPREGFAIKKRMECSEEILQIVTLIKG